MWLVDFNETVYSGWQEQVIFHGNFHLRIEQQEETCASH